MPSVTITGGSLPDVGVATFGTVAKPGTATFVPSPVLATSPAGTAAAQQERDSRAGTLRQPPPGHRGHGPAGADGPADPVGQAVSALP